MAPFDPDTEIGTNLAPKWKIWIDDFKTYMVAAGITDKKRQRALLLYQVGSRVREIFRQLPDTGENNDLDTAVTKLNEYFEPQNIVFMKSTSFVKRHKRTMNRSINTTLAYEAWQKDVSSKTRTLRLCYKLS